MSEPVDSNQAGSGVSPMNSYHSRQILFQAPSESDVHESHELREPRLDSRQALAEVLSVTMDLHKATMRKLKSMETRFADLQCLVEQKLLQPQPRTPSPGSCVQPRTQSSGSCASRFGGTSTEGLRKQILQTAAMEALEMDISQKVPDYAAKLLGTSEQIKQQIKSGPSTEESVRKPDKKSLISKRLSFSLEVGDHAERDPVADMAGDLQLQSPMPGSVLPDAPETNVKAMKRRPSSQPSVLILEAREEREEQPKDTPVRNSSGLSMTGVRSQRSGRLQEAIASGNISEVFRLQERDLVQNLSGSTSVGPSASGTERRKSMSMTTNAGLERQQAGGQAEQAENEENIENIVQEVASSSRWLYLSPLHHFLVSFVSKALGLWPLFDVLNDEQEGIWLKIRQIASRLYHWLVICGLLLGAILSGNRSALCIVEDYECGHLPALSTDLVLIVSACVVLTTWGGFWDYKKTTLRMAHSSRDISRYCANNGLAASWNMWSFTDALITVILWLVLLAGRIVILTVRIRGVTISYEEVLLFLLPFAVSTGVLCVAGFWQVRMSHAMRLIINDWSGVLLMGDASCWDLKTMWRLISGLFRKTSRAFEHCNTALCMTIVSITFATLMDARRGLLLESLAGIAVACVLPGVLIVLASTTTACKRLPSLVTLVQPAEGDVAQDAEYMELILFLSFSECGFFVWDTCVTLGLVQKFLYFTGAIAGSIGFQTGTFNFH